MAQVHPADFNHRRCLAGPAANQTAPAGEQIDFTGEHAASVNGEQALFTIGDADDFDAAVEDDKNSVLRVSLVEKNLAGLGAPLFTKGCCARNLRVIEL